MNLTTTPKCETFKADNGAEIRLYLQDCIAGMRDHVADCSVDVVVTSPPYNLGIRYNGYDDTLSREAYLSWMGDWAAEVRRVLAEDGSLFLNVGSKPSDPYVPFDILNTMRDHFMLQNVIHWVKSIAIRKAEVGKYPGVMQDVVVGHYKPINSTRFLNDCHEYIFHLTKSGNAQIDRLAVGVPYQDKSNVKRWKKSRADLHCRGNTWFIPYDTIRNGKLERPHPATFPLELPRRCMSLHGASRIRLALDPFLGIGTTAVACKWMNISCIGFELCEDYYQEACRVLMQA